jgi:hypothetical protein
MFKKKRNSLQYSPRGHAVGRVLRPTSHRPCHHTALKGHVQHGRVLIKQFSFFPCTGFSFSGDLPVTVIFHKIIFFRFFSRDLLLFFTKKNILLFGKITVNRSRKKRKKSFFIEKQQSIL